MNTNNHTTVGIIGAGPAGAMCAHELASSGVNVVLFDHRVPWEKPCGGMLSARVFDEFPLIREYPYPRLEFNEITLISPWSDVSAKELARPIYTVSRKELGRYLLNSAVTSGARFVNEKVKNLKRDRKGWHITAGNETWGADVIIGADGVNSMVKKSVGHVGSALKRVLTCGYFLAGVRDSRCVFRFLNRIGYLWVYPRPHDHSIGIGYINSSEKVTVKQLFVVLDEFIQDYCPEAGEKKRWSSLIPIAHVPHQYDAPCSGDGWICIGDAAGNVDPLTGEGIYYAMKSGQAASRSIIRSIDFNSCWNEACGFLLKDRARILNNLLDTEQRSGPDEAGVFYYLMMCE